LEAKRRGYAVIGIDISPLAAFVSRVKTLDFSNPKKFIKGVETFAELKKGKPSKLIETYYLTRLLDTEILKEVSYLREYVNSLRDSEIRDFLLSGMLASVDKVANAKKDGGWLRYIARKETPDFHSVVVKTLNKMIADITQPSLSLEYPKGHIETIVHHGDARSLPGKFPPIRLMVTSPPYLNRNDYTRVYAMEMELLGLSDKEIKEVRRATLRSHTEAGSLGNTNVKSERLKKWVEEIQENGVSNIQIPGMVRDYFEDLFLCLEQLQKVCVDGASLAFVVSNVRFSGVHIEVDSLIAEIGENLGFEASEIIVTRLRGSSAQQVNKYGDTALRESIVILRK